MAKWALEEFCHECGAGRGHQHSQECHGVAMYYQRDVLPTEGRKDDSGKARHDLLPPELPDAVAQVLAFGASKYGERNWEKGMNWGRPFAALMRHMWAWWRGEANDAETGMSHLWHAACCIAFLIAFEQRKIGKDDRPT